jgi:hypothetical protein
MADEELRQDLYKLANSTSIGCDWRAAEHFQAARRWSSVHRWLALPAAVLAGIAGTAIIAESADETIVVIAGVVALIVAALTAASGVLAPDERANQHKKGFDGFSSLRTRFLVFRDCTIELPRSGEALTQELSALLDKRDELAAAVPETPRWAQNRVRRERTQGAARRRLRRSLRPQDAGEQEGAKAVGG